MSTGICLIGLCGPMKSGKTTLAQRLDDALYDDFWKVHSFATRLRACALPLVGQDAWLQEKKDIVHPVLGVTPRSVLQEVGTTLRRHCGSDLFVRLLFNGYNGVDVALQCGDKVIIDDVRYDHEAEAIIERGGVIWEVRRSGSVYAAGGHDSERGISRHLIHATLWNDGTVNDLEAVAVALYNNLNQKKR